MFDVTFLHSQHDRCFAQCEQKPKFNSVWNFKLDRPGWQSELMNSERLNGSVTEWERTKPRLSSYDAMCLVQKKTNESESNPRSSSPWISLRRREKERERDPVNGICQNFEFVARTFFRSSAVWHKGKVIDFKYSFEPLWWWAAAKSFRSLGASAMRYLFSSPG